MKTQLVYVCLIQDIKIINFLNLKKKFTLNVERV